jgi:hypothetical protein
VVVGPSAAGKTSLLLAIGRACLLPAPGDPDLLFVPDAKTAELMKHAVRETVDDRFRRRATRRPATYGFYVQSVADGRRRRGQLVVPPLEMAIHDGPGGALFPAEVRNPYTVEDLARWRARMAESARQAASIIFCVNAENPQSDLWQTHLPELVSEVSRPAGPSRRQLQADRVLILLTKVDRLCDRALRAGRGHGPAVCSSLGGIEERAEALAHNLDPVEQARQSLGVSLLNLIRSAVKPHARLAAGITSAGGFSAGSGKPYWDRDGKPVHFAGEAADDVLRRWAPFGVRDAIVFVATGKCRGTVRQIRREDLLQDPLKVPARICVRQGGEGWR